MVEEYVCGKQLRIMIWGCFSGVSSPKLFFMNRDPLSRRNGFSSNSYLEAIEQLLDFWEPGLLFQQDNAPIHTSIKVREWFETHGIEVIEWPAYSPDLNPIEHAWARLKQTIYQLYPELVNESNDSEEARVVFEHAIAEAWALIGNEYWRALWRSLPNRLKAVREAEGWYTRY